jgi:hypothetical protein
MSRGEGASASTRRRGDSTDADPECDQREESEGHGDFGRAEGEIEAVGTVEADECGGEADRARQDRESEHRSVSRRDVSVGMTRKPKVTSGPATVTPSEIVVRW